jgi:hypothetical protein
MFAIKSKEQNILNDDTFLRSILNIKNGILKSMSKTINNRHVLNKVAPNFRMRKGVSLLAT